MKAVGIDIGLCGAIALLDDSKVIEVYDMPVKTISFKTKDTERTAYDPQALLDLFRELKDRGARLFVAEKGFTMGNEAAMVGRSIGYGEGLIEMACVAIGADYLNPMSSRWKRDLNLHLQRPAGTGRRSGTSRSKEDQKKVKELAKNKILELFPDTPKEFFFGVRGGFKDGRAEAALLAYWGLHQQVDTTKLDLLLEEAYV